MSVSVVPLDAPLGALVTGVDAREPIDGAVAAELREALTRHQVLVLRDQDLDADQQARFAGVFGELFPDPVAALRGETKLVSYIEDNAERPPAAFPWHTDLSWMAEPPKCAVLNARVIPEHGGDTLWVDLFGIYDALDADLRAQVQDLSLRHLPRPHFFETVRRHHGDEVVARLVEANPPLEHPLVRSHPESGRPALFLSPLYEDQVTGLADTDEAAALLARLDAELDDPERCLRWQWREHDLVVWDEASTCHRALGDHHPARRVMRRCAVRGSRPFHGAPAVAS